MFLFHEMLRLCIAAARKVACWFAVIRISTCAGFTMLPTQTQAELTAQQQSVCELLATVVAVAGGRADSLNVEQKDVTPALKTADMAAANCYAIWRAMNA
jgi:hypothetical protein